MSCTGRSLLGSAFVVLAHLTTGSASVGAQTPVPRPTVDLSADTVGLGDVVELRVGLRVPPGRTIYFPDSLDAIGGLERFRPVAWEAEPADGGVTNVTLTYPLIAFEVGIGMIPGFDVFVGPPSASAEPMPGGSSVGAWSDLVEDADYERAVVSPQRVWVAPLLTVDDVTGGLEPKPAADVAGSSWDWSSVVPILLLSTGLLFASAVAARSWVVGRREEESTGPGTPLDSTEALRLQTLRELKRLLELGLHTHGRMDEFYTRSSEIVRRYVESLDASWGPNLTCIELMTKLERRGSGSAPALALAMRGSEVVKFGRLRPDAREAEEYWRELWAWTNGAESPDS